MNFKLFAVIAATLAAAWVYMVSDDHRRAALEKGADAVLDRLLDE
jgi:hypothetical protein